ncbi:MAG TPA: hypothetical protein VN660_07850 [Steroidobacteraceae bacterium]|nr:hypothetical protein [Steroidobacteraceae bacterium]
MNDQFQGLDPDNARMFGSIRAVTSAAVAPLEHIARQRAASLAVHSWVRTGRGVLLCLTAAARLMGEREVIRRQRSDSREIAGPWVARGSRSRQSTQQRVIEPVVLAFELEQLPDLCGCLKVCSARCWQPVGLKGPHSQS